MAVGYSDLIHATLSMSRPIHRPPPDHFPGYLDQPDRAVSHRATYLLHTWVTASAALTGFGMGVVLGLLLCGVYCAPKTLDKLLPWMSPHKTVLVSPSRRIVLIILGSLGITGLLPKAVIAMYLCFFPVTVAMVRFAIRHNA